MRSKFSATSGPNILFESRISELEAQLTQMDIDYKKIADENSELKRKRAFGGDPVIDSSCSDAYKKQIDNLQRDKTSLEDMVKKLQKQITELKSLDAQVFSKTQRNRDMAEQANFERTQADIEIRRLKVVQARLSMSLAVVWLCLIAGWIGASARTHARVAGRNGEEDFGRAKQCRSSLHLSSNILMNLTKYLKLAQLSLTQVDQLGGDLTSQWEQSSKLQLDLERMKRVESDQKRELASRNNQIEELKTEMKMKNTAHLSDLTQINGEKHSLEQEITSLRWAPNAIVLIVGTFALSPECNARDRIVKARRRSHVWMLRPARCVKDWIAPMLTCCIRAARTCDCAIKSPTWRKRWEYLLIVWHFERCACK